MADEKKEATPATSDVPAISQGKTAEPRATQSVEVTTSRSVTSSGGSGAGAGGAFDGGMFYIIAPFVILFWLFILRPEKKRRDAQLATLSAIKKDDKVVLAGAGIYGTVASIDGDEVVLVIDSKKDVRIKVRKDAIGTIVDKDAKK